MANFASPPESRAADAPAARPRETVGDLLKRARVEQGAEIDQIASALRIRASYLVAIEQARYDRLPGVVYALGFVRAYANQLGLDGDEAVRRFKLESAGLEQRRDLAFPMPLTARSIPGGRLALIAIVLGVCAYGVWHYVSTGERDRPERVAAVPTSLLPPPAPAPATAAPPPAQAAPGEAAPAAAAPTTTAGGTAPEPAPVSTSPLPPPATDAAPTASQPGASLVAPPPPQAAQAPDKTASLTPPPQSGESATPAANPTPPTDAASTAAPTATAPASAAAGQPAAGATAAATPAAAPPAPRVFGAIDGPSHITLHAIKDCWIQVRTDDPAQTVIAQRTLHAGDSYRVPDKTGLTLRTGNASVLQVLVDDRAAPALAGTVREVSLDPAKLVAGKAAE